MTAESSARAVSQGLEEDFLSWENLGAQPVSRAFFQSLGELMFHPARFFDRMATSGGLHEPLSFFGLVAAAAVVLSFPLALAYFGLTAPDPSRVATEVYNLHLSAPRLTGFLTLLLPLTLVLAALQVLLVGSMLALGGRAFGVRSWEGSVSVVSYSAGAALTPLVGAMALSGALCIGLYVLTVFVPGASTTASSIARPCVQALMGLGALAGTTWFVVLLFVGCARSFDLGGARGSAAALAGLVLAGVLYVGIPVSYAGRGGRAAVITGAVLAAVLVVLWMVRVCLNLRTPQAG